MAEWKIRIIEHDEEAEPYLALHEVYYSDNGTITLWSEEPITILGKANKGPTLCLKGLNDNGISEVIKISELVGV